MKDLFWIDGDPSLGLAIALRPRGGDWLEDEVLRLKHNGVTTLVSMLENEEAKELGLEDEGLLANRAGLTFLLHPIPDRHVPSDVASFKSFVSELAKRLRKGERVAVHCRGSIGRATIAAASTLIQFGWNPQTALAAIERARKCPVPDTTEQRDWILRYEAQL